MLDEAGAHRLAEPAQPFGQGLFVKVPGRDKARVEGGPGLRVPRFVEREEVVEGPRRSVARRERVAEVPSLPQGGDQGGVAVLVVEHSALRDPGRDEDRGNAIAGAVER